MSSTTDSGLYGDRLGIEVENPFFHRGPIRDPQYFYNRRLEVKHTLRMLSNRQSVSVIGPRKIGKTSFLFHVCRPEVMQEYGLDPSHYLCVYINCEDLGRLGQQGLYALLAGEIADQATQQGCDIVMPEHPVSHLEFERAIAGVFERDLTLVLIFDEFELLSENENLDLAFFSGLRALATRFGLAYLTCSRRPLLGLPHSLDYSPFFNIFCPVRLGLFDQEASRNLIAGYLDKVAASLPSAIIDGVLEMGGGHPFFLQVAGYWALELQQAKGSSLEDRDLVLLEHSIRGQIESHLDYYWNHLTDVERYVLAALPFTQEEGRYREELDALVSDCLVVPPGSLTYSIGQTNSVSQTNLVRIMGGGEYRYFSPLFRGFVRRQQVEELFQAGPFVLDLAHQRLLHREHPLSLSTSQFELLSYLIQRHGQVISSQELDREVLGTPGEMYEYLTDERLKSAIKGLRKTLGEDGACIENKRGIGYVFRVRPSLE
jgi:DNA-binding winged helix-turn-helix (wHTH) protein